MAVTPNFVFTSYNRFSPPTLFSFLAPLEVLVFEAISNPTTLNSQYSTSALITSLFSLTDNSIVAENKFYSVIENVPFNILEVITRVAGDSILESFDNLDANTLNIVNSLSDVFTITEATTTLEIFSLIESIISTASYEAQGVFYLSLTSSLLMLSNAIDVRVIVGLITELSSYFDVPNSVQLATISNLISFVETLLPSTSTSLSSTINTSLTQVSQAIFKGDNIESISINSSSYLNVYLTLIDLLDVSIGLGIIDYLSVPDTLSLTDSNGQLSRLEVTLSNIIGINTLLKLLPTASISEVLTGTDSTLTLAKRIGTLLSNINLSEIYTFSEKLFLTLVDTLLIIQESSYSLFGSISEVMEYNILLETLRQSIDSILESITTLDNVPYGSVILVPIEDFIDISSEESIQSIIQALLSDELLLVLPKALGGNNYFTYAFSPERSTISTYSNYNFDGCCTFRDKYLFFNNTGIYEYGGNYDNGIPIQSEITTSAMMYTTSNLKSVPSVYLGVTNSDVVILKVRTDGKGEFTYKLNKHTDNLGTQKINIGKGVIGRYFQFSLITSAEEFDLSSIEFLPLTLKRKI